MKTCAERKIMIDPGNPCFIPILLPSDTAVLSSGEDHEALLLSAVYGANPRLAEFCAQARRMADTLLVDPKTPHFQFAGYMSMPDYRALPYSPGRHTLGSMWEPAHFSSERRREWLVEEVLAVQANMGADILLAPYFYVRSVNDPWLFVARDCARSAIQTRSGHPVGVVISVDIDAFIDASHRAAICETFSTLEADLFWINIVNFDEVAAEPVDVAAAMALVDSLVATGRPVVLGYVGRAGLLAVAHGAAGFAAGTHGLETHPPSFFREMMGSKVANSYYVRDCMMNLPVRLAEAVLNSGAGSDVLGCECRGCSGSTSVSRMVSRRLSWHSMFSRSRELESLEDLPTESRLPVVERLFHEALARCEAVAAELGSEDGQPVLPPGAYHYLEVLREVSGGPPATIPGDDSF